MSYGLRAAAVALLLASTACPGDEGEGTTEAGATEAGATEAGTTEAGTTEAGATEAGATEGTTEGMGADSTTGGASDGGVVEACGLPMPCSQYTFSCNPINGLEDECAAEPYPEELVCMLETLAAGEQAQLYVSFNGIVTGEVEWVDVAVYGADAALYQHGLEDPGDFSIYWDPAQRCAPKPAAYFEACLADAGDGVQHTDCMNPYDWFEGCAEATQCL